MLSINLDEDKVPSSLRPKIVADVLIPNVTRRYEVEKSLSEARKKAKTHLIPSLLSFWNLLFVPTEWRSRHTCDGSSVGALFNAGEGVQSQKNRTNFYNTSTPQSTTVTMTTITQFQVVQQTATELSIALQDIQNNVQRVSPQDPLASCYTVRGLAVVGLRVFFTSPIFRFLAVLLLVSVIKSWRAQRILRNVSISSISHISKACMLIRKYSCNKQYIHRSS